MNLFFIESVLIIILKCKGKIMRKLLILLGFAFLFVQPAQAQFFGVFGLGGSSGGLGISVPSTFVNPSVYGFYGTSPTYGVQVSPIIRPNQPLRTTSPTLPQVYQQPYTQQTTIQQGVCCPRTNVVVPNQFSQSRTGVSTPQIIQPGIGIGQPGFGQLNQPGFTPRTGITQPGF